MNNHEFDLLIHDWIPCLAPEGIPKLLQHSIGPGKCTPSPINRTRIPVVRIATLRLLLAFCYRVACANGVPLCSFRNWKALQTEWREGIPSKWIDHYLNAYNCWDRFRLFDDKYPFFQVAGLECQGASQPEAATRLVFEQFAGTPTSLWEHLPEVPSVRAGRSVPRDVPGLRRERQQHKRCQGGRPGILADRPHICASVHRMHGLAGRRQSA